MTRYLKIFCAAFFVLGVMVLLTPSADASRSEGIAVVVNEDAITFSDLNDRLLLIIASSGLPNTPDTRQKLTPQVVNALIDEQIRMQEARRLDLEISQGEINEGFVKIAEQNQRDPQEFRSMIQQSGLNVGTMENQIRSQLAWSKVVQARLRPQVVVTDGDIDNYLDRVAGNTGKPEYLLAEIFLPVDSPSEDAQTRQVAQKLVDEIRGGQASFFKVAQQFSKSAGAPQGGDLGWVGQGQLQRELDEVLPRIAVGEISNPVRTSTGYHILSVREQRVVSEENMPSREDVRSILGTQRLERLQRRYLLDLKSAAFIENRLVQAP